MVKSGIATPGALTANLDPLTIGNALAIAAWNRLGGEIRYPDVIYALARDDVDDLDLMLERLDALQALMKESRADGK